MRAFRFRFRLGSLKHFVDPVGRSSSALEEIADRGQRAHRAVELPPVDPDRHQTTQGQNALKDKQHTQSEHDHIGDEPQKNTPGMRTVRRRIARIDFS